MIQVRMSSREEKIIFRRIEDDTWFIKQTVVSQWFFANTLPSGAVFMVFSWQRNILSALRDENQQIFFVF